MLQNMHWAPDIEQDRDSVKNIAHRFTDDVLKNDNNLERMG